MNVCVLGLWHLGTVTTACLAAGGHTVCGLDFDDTVVANLSAGKPPLFEPGLDDLVNAGLASGRLRFTGDVKSAVSTADVVWITYDTPVDDDDRADVGYVIERTRAVLPHLRDGALVLVSSQVPVGTTRQLEKEFASESMVAQWALPTFRRICVWARRSTSSRTPTAWSPACDQTPTAKVTELFKPFTTHRWMSVESAEMTKHALNTFLPHR